MANAGWLPTSRPEPYRPDGLVSGLDEPGFLARVYDRMHPDEGWSSLPLILLLVGTMAWSISDARWILGRDELTSFLIWVALAAALWGYVSGRFNLSPWLAHLLGCTIGAFVLIEAVGASLPGATPGLVGWFHATTNSVAQAYLDLAWRHQPTTIQTGHFGLILGIVVWGTAQAASYDVFGHRRTVNGVLLLALVLIANMALTPNDQFAALVAFSAAALALLLLAHAADERSNWLRRRIWRGREFRTPHLQGGVVFAAVAVAGSLILTTVASSAPLASTFSGPGSRFESALSWLDGLLPNGGASRIQPSADFGATAPISSSFHESAHPVFTISIPNGSAYHWRLVAYNDFQSTGWSLGPDTQQDQVGAGSTLESGTLDLVGATTPGRTEVSITVHVQDTTIRHLIVADEPDSVNVGVQRTLVGNSPSSLDIASLTSDATDYLVEAYVPDADPSGNGLTQWRLRHAGTDYPTGLQARYTQGTDLVGSQGKALLSEIANWARANGNAFNTEYDVASAIQDYLRSDRFVYNTDISALIPRCAGLSTVDCFALVREGFCEQYATTMTMLMRMEGYPARYVQGYLPGAIDQNTRVEQVTSQQKHAWVEVFFPTYGWITFDPTGGGVGQPTVLVPGSAATASPTASSSTNPGKSAGAGSSNGPASGQGGGTTVPGGPAGVLVPTTGGAILALVLLVYWRRRPRRLEGAEDVYRRVVRLASRLGYRPRPTQTVYEYAGMLADLVPEARDSLGVVAMATVEVTYGRRQLGSARLVALADAHRLVRQALLRLALRLPKLRHGGGKPDGPGGRGGAAGRPRR
jgi:transglutaminase-like putative cysteine protease